MSQSPVNRVGLDWLALREPADAATRTKHTSELVTALDDHLRRRLGRDTTATRLMDVGAGTGAGARWLRPQLSVEQDWLLLDHDPRVLDAAGPCADGWARGIVATVADLPVLLRERPVDVVSCQALLDVLTAAEVGAMLTAASTCGAALLLSLSVSGEVSMSPPHPEDDRVSRAFDAHQRRAGRLGPDAPEYAMARLRRLGYTVTSVATPWELGGGDVSLIRAWLNGRAEAAQEQSPGAAREVARWHAERDRMASRGELTATVGHVDVLALPSPL